MGRWAEEREEEQEEEERTERIECSRTVGKHPDTCKSRFESPNWKKRTTIPVFLYSAVDVFRAILYRIAGERKGEEGMAGSSRIGPPGCGTVGRGLSWKLKKQHGEQLACSTFFSVTSFGAR